MERVRQMESQQRETHGVTEKMEKNPEKPRLGVRQRESERKTKRGVEQKERGKTRKFQNRN